VRVWSVSPFFNELDVLEIRLATLDPLVDVFVLAEATVDQRGRPKPLHLSALGDAWGGLAERFAPWGHKIRVVTVDDMPERRDFDGTPQHWRREHFQRDALARGMADLADDDVVLICDLDEIPYPEALAEGIERPGLRFPMDMHVYRLNWRWTERPVRDGSTAVTRRGDYLWGRSVHEALLDPDGARWRVDPATQLAVSSGWHLAYMYDQEGIRRKVGAIADDAWAQLVPEAKKADPGFWPLLAGVPQPSSLLLDRCVETGCDVFGRDYRQAEWVGLDQLPLYVSDHPERFAHLLVQGGRR
jgi:beta-1,4-mannosyl-glycoprotein beta-1,4-N-acetylglucosaminyltransferase